jgi:hypothetical protein
MSCRAYFRNVRMRLGRTSYQQYPWIYMVRTVGCLRRIAGLKMKLIATEIKREYAMFVCGEANDRIAWTSGAVGQPDFKPGSG